MRWWQDDSEVRGIYLFFLQCLTWGFCCYDEAGLGGKGLCDLHVHSTVHHRRKARLKLKNGRNLEEDLIQRPWRSAAYWLAPRGLLSLLAYRTQDHLPRGPSPSITN